MTRPLDVDRANTIVYCRRWQACVTFYRDGLGFEETFSNDWFVELAITDSARLSVADARRASIRSAEGRGLTLTLRVADARAARQTLAGRGLELGEIRRHPWGADVFHLRDPDGNRVELWSQ